MNIIKENYDKYIWQLRIQVYMKYSYLYLYLYLTIDLLCNWKLQNLLCDLNKEMTTISLEAREHSFFTVKHTCSLKADNLLLWKMEFSLVSFHCFEIKQMRFVSSKSNRPFLKTVYTLLPHPIPSTHSKISFLSYSPLFFPDITKGSPLENNETPA